MMEALRGLKCVGKFYTAFSLPFDFPEAVSTFVGH